MRLRGGQCFSPQKIPSLDNSSSSIWNNKRVFVFSEVVTMARLMVSPDSNLFEFQIEKVKSGVLCFVVETQMTKIA